MLNKKVSLEFAGEEYKDDFLKFKSIAFKDYGELSKKAEQYKDDNQKSLDFIQNQITDRFIEGEVTGDDGKIKVTKENVLDLPGEILVECFAQLMGKSQTS